MCHESLLNISNKIREEMALVKADMDLAGIFHPDANAHRVHCMYLMRVYNGTRADTIEDPGMSMSKSMSMSMSMSMSNLKGIKGS